ncbi:PaaI family thioesterase [Microbacteriaceae bacterium K1510]|nr:PaaI family thioesterase [Microbacteriaceae bacterium K1510]
MTVAMTPSDIEARIRESFAKQTIMQTIGAEVLAVRAGEVEIVLPFSDKVLQQHGFVHAGAVATIADSACGYAGLSVMPADAAVLTTEFKINLLSPAKGDRLRAVGRVIRNGKTLVVTLGEVFAETGGTSKQVAMITATMMVVSTGTGLRD